MSVASLDPNDLEAYVVRVKAAWRDTERNQTWEEKVAASERMRERDRAVKAAREALPLPPIKQCKASRRPQTVRRVAGWLRPL